MMKKFNKKKKLILPSDYQELLVSNEIELANGVTVEVIRKLVYLYTIGMDYYNISGKAALEKFYNDKLVSLLTHPVVAEFLDKNKVDLNSNNDLNLFSKDSLEENGKTRYSVFFHEKKEEETETPIQTRMAINDKRDLDLNNTMERKRTVANKDSAERMKEKDLKLKIKDQVTKVDAKLTKINDNISQSVVAQMAAFEEKRREKQALKRKNSMTKCVIRTSKLTDEAEEQIQYNTGQRFSFAHQDSSDQFGSDQKSVKRRRVSIGQNPMLKEVEEYVEKNMSDMFKALDELKKTFELEIAEAESNGFPDIAESLREDMKSELDNMKDQFEEQRRIETEKIRGRFKNGSFYRQQG